MAFDGTLWGRRVQLTGLTPVATATGFVALITEDNLPAEAIDAGSNSALNGGGDVRFSTDNAGATQLPLEVERYTVSSTPSLRSARMWIRFTSYESANRSVWMFYNRAGQTQPPVTDTFGRNNVWQDFEAVWHFSSTVDSTGNGYDLTLGSEVTQNTDSITFSGANSNSEATFSTLTQSTGRVRVLFNTTTTSSNIFSGYSGATNNWFGVLNGDIRYRPPDVNVGGATLPSANVNYFAEITNIGSNASLRLFNASGSQIGSTASGSNPSGRITDMFGDFTNNGGVRYTGDLIECQVSLSNVPQSQVNLERSNQANPNAFWTTGTPEDTGGSTGVNASISFDVPSPTFSVSASNTRPTFNAQVDIDIPSPEFAITASATSPNFDASIAFNIPSPTFSVSASNTRPEFNSSINFDVAAPEFSITASNTQPGFSSTVNLTVPSPVFSVEASVTLPTFEAAIGFEVPSPRFFITNLPLEADFTGTLKSSLFSGIINRVEFTGYIKTQSFSGQTKTSEFRGTIKQSIFTGVYNGNG